VERPAEGLPRPEHRLGVERLADAGQVAQRGEIERRTRSRPSFISSRIAVGAEYQTVTRCFSMNWYQRSALKPASSTTCVTPFAQGPMMPYEVPVTQPGSALHQ
jgi:hypothetical protein